MSKKTPVKKSKRRLKKTVRRSLAAILMISAIGVAAIPVPENIAAEEGGAAARAVEDVHPAITYDSVKAEKGSDWDIADITPDSLKEYADEKILAKADLNNDKILSEEERYDYLYDRLYPKEDKLESGEKQLYQSLQIIPRGANGYELTWEYIYYLGSVGSAKDQGVLCNYNKQYLGQKVDLASKPITSFFRIKDVDFNAYFTDGPISSGNKFYLKNADKNVTGNYAKIYDMDVEMAVNPLTEKVSYTYQDYKNYGIFTAENVKDAPDNIQFLIKYAPSVYGACNTAFANYEKRLEEYNTAVDEWYNNLPTDTNPLPTKDDYPGPVEKPADSEFTASEIKDATMSSLMADSLDDKIRFFCENCKSLTSNYGSGYTLISVTDSTREGSGTGNASNSYIACKDAGGNASDTDNIVVNGKEFLVTNGRGPLLFAIGKGALKNIQNSANIEIPTSISYIGDEAFLGNTKVKTLSIDNVANIGNRAFSGCTALTTLTMTEGVNTIGTECFLGCNQLTEIKFANGLTRIGNGAFADCTSLSTLDLNALKSACVIGDAAFWNCASLSNVSMESANIESIGKAAFGVVNTNSLSTFTFPSENGMTKKGCMGDYMFNGRSILKTVVMPRGYGSNTADTIPPNMFHGCFALELVEFPVTANSPYSCSLLSYDPDKLFADVTNENFYVKGPETSDGSTTALPRSSTWDAITRAFPEKGFVPYMYVADGMECYEVCNEDGYLGCVRKNDDGTGTLISYRMKDGVRPPSDGKLVIPDYVGNIPVIAIDSNCFSDESLTQTVRTLIINNNITEIADYTFKNTKKNAADPGKWRKLASVTIGSGITSVGVEAFADCDMLEDVTFVTPKGQDYGLLKTIGTNAFKTNGLRLTIHGDINQTYQPFIYATETTAYDNGKTDVKNYVGSETTGTRIRYQSKWDSPVGKKLTVMYGKLNEGADSEITLLDYPKYDEIAAEIATPGSELEQYCRSRENEIYNSYLGGDENEAKRQEFAKKWDELKKNGMSDDDAMDQISVMKYKYGEEEEEIPYYGPWINPTFCNDWKNWIPPTPDSGDGGTSGSTTWNTLTDWLFEPIVAEAASGDPTPYYSYSGNEYDFIKIYENNLANAQNPYEGLTSYEQSIIDSVINIVVPSGIGSIDVADFYNNNVEQFSGDINLRPYELPVEYYRTQLDDAVPGLFSGYIEDYDDSESADDEKNETDVRGNDRIQSVTLTDVKKLPDYTFDNCEQLTKVLLGSPMKEVGALPFRDCAKLTDLVSASEDCPANNGILYERITGADDTVTYNLVECLLARGQSGGGILSDSRLMSVSSETDTPYIGALSSIDASAFENCDSLSLVNLQDATSLKQIPENTFKDCDSLARIVLPVSVNSIKSGAFEDVHKSDKGQQRLTVTIKGKEVFIASDAFGYSDATEDSEKKYGAWIETYEGTSAYEYATYYEKEGMHVSFPPLEDMYSVIYMDHESKQIGDTIYLDSGAKIVIPDIVKEYEDTVANDRKGYTFIGWKGSNGQQIGDNISGDIIFTPQFESDGTMVNGYYTVEFYDGFNGESLNGGGATRVGSKWVYYIAPDVSFEQYETEEEYSQYNIAAPKEAPNHEADGYEFIKWIANGQDWNKADPISSNTVIFALYGKTTSSDGTTTTSGTTTNTSGSTTNNSSGSTNNTSNTTTTSSTLSTSTTSSSTSSSSTSTSSTTSGSGSTASAPATYSVFVENGSGSGYYPAGATVIISANIPAAGMKFNNWTTSSNGVNLLSTSMAATTFTMPANNVTVTANYVADTTPTSTAGTTGGTTTPDDGSTRVDITKPGISNKDLATADVNGSTDNFIVKITETDEATQAVAAALTNKYNSLDNILYYAMDISLYDSTGTTKITDVSGLSIDITIPLPDALIPYGGNNMAGAVVNGNQLENLNERFTTVNGVPMVTFTATHFSPYTIYVDTGNLSAEGMLDVTPKTGDPIHPKWFLSIGLACLSIILFIKKDKTAKKMA